MNDVISKVMFFLLVSDDTVNHIALSPKNVNILDLFDYDIEIKVLNTFK